MSEENGSVRSGPWDLEELRRTVEAYFGEDRANHCWKSLQSIVERQSFAGYHFREYLRLIAVRFPAGRTHEEELITMFTNDDQALRNLRVEQEAAAHVVACMQSIHAVNDTLAHVIFWALAPIWPRLEQLGEHGVDLSRLGGVLSDGPLTVEMNAMIKTLIEHPDMVYLSDVVNHGKHRRIVGPKIMIDADSDGLAKPVLEIEPFQHVTRAATRTYDVRSVDSFLNTAYGLQSQTVVSIGKSIGPLILAKRLGQ